MDSKHDWPGVAHEVLLQPGHSRSFPHDLQEDAAQEAALIALRRRPRDMARLQPWLRRIASRLTLRLHRRETACKSRELYGAAPLTCATPLENLALRETREHIDRALETLDEKYSAVLRLRYLEGHSMRATAELLGLPVETVRTRQRRGLELLRHQPDVRRVRDRLAGLLGLPLFRRFRGRSAWSVLAAGVLVVAWHTPPGGLARSQVEANVLALVPNPLAPEQLSSRSVAVPRERVAEALATASVARTWRVVDAVDRLPLPYERVYVDHQAWWGWERGRWVRSDAKGEVVIPNQPAGTWRVSPQRGQALLIADDTPRGEVLVDRGQRLNILAVDPQGRRVPGAEILLSLPGRPDRELLAGHCDSLGQLALENVDARAWIGACLPGSPLGAMQPLDPTSYAGAARLEALTIALRVEMESEELRGVVLTPGGAPCAGAELQLRLTAPTTELAWSRGIPRDPPLAYADARGRFTLPVSARHVHGTLRVTAADGSAALVPVSTAEHSLQVHLRRARSLMGVARRPDGQPASWAELSITSEFDRHTLEAKADEQGRFAVEHLPPGELHAIAALNHDGFFVAELDVHSDAPDETRWDARLAPGGACRVQVVGGPDPATALFRSRLVDFNGRRLAPRLVADRSLVFFPVPAGPHQLHISVDGVPRYHRRGVQRDTGVVEAYINPPGLSTVLGCVASMSLGDGLGVSARSAWHPLGLRRFSTPDIIPLNARGAQGCFRQGALPPGRYQLLELAPEREPLTLGEFDLAPGQALELSQALE